MTERRPLVLVLDWPSGSGSVPVTVVSRTLYWWELAVHRLTVMVGWRKVRRPVTRCEDFTATVGVETDERTYRMLTGLTCSGTHPGIVLIPPMREVEYDVENKIKL
jgi:hypothetical protein